MTASFIFMNGGSTTSGPIVEVTALNQIEKHLLDAKRVRVQKLDMAATAIAGFLNHRHVVLLPEAHEPENKLPYVPNNPELQKTLIEACLTHSQNDIIHVVDTSIRQPVYTIKRVTN